MEYRDDSATPVISSGIRSKESENNGIDLWRLAKPNRFLARQTNFTFSQVVLKRSPICHISQPPLSLSQLIQKMKFSDSSWPWRPPKAVASCFCMVLERTERRTGISAWLQYGDPPGTPHSLLSSKGW
ncbi:hypothetical protein U0070_019853, partial [Myodes glareolus]